MPWVAVPIATRLSRGMKIDPESNCHVWQGALYGDGYGMIQADGGAKSLRTHRVAYELAKGPISPGLVIDHLCRNILCCNADHLEAVTVRENTLRGEAPTAKFARAEVCKHGHPFSPENTYLRPSGGRRCRTCARRLGREKYHRDSPLQGRPFESNRARKA